MTKKITDLEGRLAASFKRVDKKALTNSISKPIPDMSRSELIAMGFCPWQEDLLLIPCKLWVSIPDGTLLYSAGYNSKAVKSKEWKDHARFGEFMRWGLRPK